MTLNGRWTTWLGAGSIVASLAAGYGVMQQRVKGLEQQMETERSAHDLFESRMRDHEKSLAVIQAVLVEVRLEIRRHHPDLHEP